MSEPLILCTFPRSYLYLMDKEMLPTQIDNHICLFDPNACMHIIITVYIFIPRSVLQLLSFFLLF